MDHHVKQGANTVCIKKNFFYNGKLIASVKQGAQQLRILRASDTPLAQTGSPAASDVTLFASNDSRSISAARQRSHPHAISYSPYGYCPVQKSPVALGFNGERHETSGLYLLGNGNRAYSPVLMRFMSPDRVGVFIPGNSNSYAYVAGDPINHYDPSGNIPLPIKPILKSGNSHKNSTSHARKVTFSNEVTIREHFKSELLTAKVDFFKSQKAFTNFETNEHLHDPSPINHDTLDEYGISALNNGVKLLTAYKDEINSTNDPSYEHTKNNHSREATRVEEKLNHTFFTLTDHLPRLLQPNISESGIHLRDRIFVSIINYVRQAKN